MVSNHKRRTFNERHEYPFLALFYESGDASVIDGADYGRLESLAELEASFKMGMEVVFTLRGVKYTTGWDKHGFFIATCPDGDGTYFGDYEDMLQNFMIDGRPIREYWLMMEIETM